MCISIHRRSVFYCSFDILWICKSSLQNRLLYLIILYSNIAPRSICCSWSQIKRQASQTTALSTNVYNMLSLEIDEEYCVCQNFPFQEHTRGVWNAHSHRPTKGQAEVGKSQWGKTLGSLPRGSSDCHPY